MADDKTRILTAEDAKRLAALTAESDDRTRVLSADEAAKVLARAKAPAAPGSPAPRLVADKIVFFCSNGHRLVVDKSLAGKKGNCSKQGCGVPVSIPVPPGLELPVAEPPPSVGPEGGGAESPEATLDAPAELPPVFDLGVNSPLPPPAPANPPSAPGAAADAPLWDFVAGGPESAPAAAGTLALPASAAGDWAFDAGDIDHPAARLVARLWQERSHGGVVEVHLAGGGVILPEFYDPRWSCGGHAVFAALAPDGTVTLTAVAWEQVQKVVVRQVQGKPDGMFGD